MFVLYSQGHDHKTRLLALSHTHTHVSVIKNFPDSESHFREIAFMFAASTLN